MIDVEGWIVERLVVGELMVNCYLVGCGSTREAVVVDPGGEAERILDRIERENLRIRAVVNTHGHGDHIGANREIVEATGAPLWIGARDAPVLPDAMRNLSAPFGLPVTSPAADGLLREGDRIELGDRTLRVIETPGHSPGGITPVSYTHLTLPTN